MTKVEGIILDWAGTAVDFGCFAPVNVFIEIFRTAGVDVTLEEARRPMGMLKRDHIRAMLEMERISGIWKEKYGKNPDDDDVNNLYYEFEPLLFSSLSKYTEPLPHVLDVVNEIRSMGLKIGSTTGYTDAMMKIVTEGAKEKGYAPDCWISPDSTGEKGRPYPYMIFKNMEKLGLTAPWRVIKIGDTESDIKEGINAGAWSVGVVEGSSQMGLSRDEYESLSDESKDDVVRRTRESFLSFGSDFTIRSLKDLPELVGRIDKMIFDGKRPGGRPTLK